jgi:putative ABC transport system permease protein
MMFTTALRIALASVRGEMARYRTTPALLAGAVAMGVGFAVPLLWLYRRPLLLPLRGGDLDLTWRAGVMPPAAVQQEAVDALGDLLLGASLGTIAIAAVTILVLSLAREAERSGEVAVRRAVGAGRRILLGSALIEWAIVALAGAASGAIVGLLVTAAMTDWPGLLRPSRFALSGLALGALMLGVLAGMVFPVLFPRRRVGEAVPLSPTPLTPSAIQIGACLIALTMAGLLARHADGMLRSRPAETAGIVHSISMSGAPVAERSRRYAELLGAVTAGGSPVSLTSPGGLLGLGPVGTVTTDCGQCSEGGIPLRFKVKPAVHHFVTADTFQMLGIRVVEGRSITAADRWGTSRVAVINRSLAAREFQFGQPIGRGIRVVDDGDQWATVVGVVNDPPATGIGSTLQPRYTVYLSVLQYPPAAVDLLTPRSADETTLLAATRAALGQQAVDSTPAPMGALLAGQAAPLRWFAAQFGLQGWAMLGIAALGALAAARLWVTSLLGELGLRRALGARRRRTLALVLGRAAAVCGAGIAGGVWFGLAIWNVLADLVPGLHSWDLTLVLRYSLVLLFAVLAGALPPAWRAARTAPASLLSAS